MNIDLERLARMIAMLDSDNEGVRAAAFNRADAAVTAAGLVWTEVLAEIFRPKDAQPMRLSHVEFGHVDQCRDILRNHKDFLTKWERNFLAKICERMFLTQPQAARFDQIAVNVVFRREHRAEFGQD